MNSIRKYQLNVSNLPDRGCSSAPRWKQEVVRINGTITRGAKEKNGAPFPMGGRGLCEWERHVNRHGAWSRRRLRPEWTSLSRIRHLGRPGEVV